MLWRVTRAARQDFCRTTSAAGVLMPFPPADLDLWPVPLETDDDGAAAALDALSDDERSRAAAFQQPHLRRRFAVARAALRALLAAPLGVQPSAVRFVYGPNGKPF